VQVVVALSVTPGGFPIAYEVLPGNTADKTTLKMFLQRIETQYGKAERIWVMDCGIPTEEVLEEMRTADPPLYYLVGTPKGRLTRLERDLPPLPWATVWPGVQVKLLPQEQELYVCAESCDRLHKERAMRRRQLKRLFKRLKQLQQMKFNDTRQLLLKLGEAKGRYRAAWRLIDLVLPQAQASGAATEPILVPPQSEEAARGAPARGTLVTAYESLWAGSGGSLAVLPPAHGGRGGVQKPQR
jgi:hypothetical protein